MVALPLPRHEDGALGGTMTNEKRKPATTRAATNKPKGLPLPVPKEFVLNCLRRGFSAAREMFPAWTGSTEELIAALEAHKGQILVPDVGLFTHAEYEEFVLQFYSHPATTPSRARPA